LVEREAIALELQQRLRTQAVEAIDQLLPPEDRLRRREGEAADEDRGPCQRLLFAFGEQVPREGERAGQRPVPPGVVGTQQLEALGYPLEELARREDSHARGGQLDGERQAVEPADQVADRLVIL